MKRCALLLALLAIGCSDSSEATSPFGDGTGDATDGHSGAAAAGGRDAGRTDAGSAGAGGRDAGGSINDGGATDGSPDARDASISVREGGAPDVTVGPREAGREGGEDVAPLPIGPGALVAYDIRSSEKALHVLDPETGRSRSSEPFGTVRGIVHEGAHDGSSERWYVFEQQGSADDGMVVHVRALDDVTGAFTELGSLSGAPLAFGGAVAFGKNGNSFVAYLSDATPGALPAAKPSLTVVDATDPTKPTLLPAAATPLPNGAVLGLASDGFAPAVVVAQTPPCPQSSAGVPACNVRLVPVTVTTSAIAIGAAVVVGQTGAAGNADFASDPFRHSIIMGLPALSPPDKPECGSSSRSSGRVRAFSTQGSPAGLDVSIPVEAPRFSGAAFDACDDIMFLTSVAADVAIWAAPLGAAGAVTKLCMPTPGGELLYETSSRSLFRALPSAGIEAYRVGAKDGSPTLTRRSLDELPAGFQAGALAVRTRILCP